MKIDVGCGSRKRKGYIGSDIIKLPSVDIVFDMNIKHWPFRNNTFDEIIFDDVLEHSKDIITTLEEAYRVAKNRAIIKISVPHFSSDNMYTDPTHKVFFSSRSFNYFDKSYPNRYIYSPSINLKVIRKYISFGEYFIYDYKNAKFNLLKITGLEYLINKMQRIYEKFFSWIFPASELYFELEVIKKENV